MFYKSLLALATAAAAVTMSAGVVQVGSASYSDAFPGTDKEGRNATPPGTPQLSGIAATKPAPTNEWWCNELQNNHGKAMFNYPMGVRTENNGIVLINPMIGGGLAADTPILIGVDGTASERTTVSNHSDWSVTYAWNNMEATVLHGSPMVYFTKTSDAPVKITATSTMSASGNVLTVSGGFNNASYAVFAPEGSVWNVSGTTATSTLNGKNYWSAVMMQGTSVADKFKPHAFVFPKETRAEYAYNESTGEVTATYRFVTDVKEGTETRPVMGMLPHHWGNLKTQPQMLGVSYSTVRGELKMVADDSFTTSLRFTGVLPVVPAMQNSATGYSQAELNRLVDDVVNNSGLSDWTDSYNDGQLLNRLMQAARVAAQSGYTHGFDRAFAMVKQHVERWLTYSQGDVAFLFYYHQPWQTMLGYPAGHGQDSNINDHHFHWGYFIAAAAFIEQYQPGWAQRYGDMINLLVRDAASPDRDDTMFPYLRNFSVFGGHAWANGMIGTEPMGPGIDQESTSESMNFNTALINWGSVTGNKKIRNLGIALYAIEQSAVEEYWFDVNNRIFSRFDAGWSNVIASRVFANSFDCNNFWGAPIQGSYGIQVYPVHAGSAYLVNNTAFAKKFWQAIKEKTPLLKNTDDPNTWHDPFIQFAAMLDPQEALTLYNNSQHLGEKFGVTQAQTYQNVHALSAIGVPDRTVTADSPLAMVYQKDGVRTYSAQNYSDQPLIVRFSDGYVLEVPAHSMAVATAGASDRKVIPDTPASDNPANLYPKCDFNYTNWEPTHEAGNHFKGGFYIHCSTEGTVVTVTAKFEEKSGTYSNPTVMFVNKDSGQTTPMTRNSDGVWTCTFNEALSTVIKFRIELRYDGNTATADDCAYVVGNNCDGQTVDPDPTPVEPRVTLSASSTGVTTGTDVTLVAGTTVPADVTVSKVEFMVGDAVVGTREAAPFTCTWNAAAAGTYAVKAVMTLSDGRTATSGTVTVTVTDKTVDPDPSAGAPTTVPDPVHDKDKVVSVYSHAYPDAVTSHFGNWGQSTQAEIISIDGKKVYKFSKFNYMGIELDSDIDLSGYTHMHVDYWTPDGSALSFTPIARDRKSGAVEAETHYTATPRQNEWNSYDVPLTHFSNEYTAAVSAQDATYATPMGKIFQIKFDKGGNSTGYVANVYFHNANDGTVDPGPENPDVPFQGDCVTTGTQASEGTFNGDYTVACQTLDNGAVRVTASFAGSYNGLDGPWLHNVTNGFAETRMTAGANGTYYTDLTGYSKGDVIKFRVKIAFAGGLAVTRDIEYTVGNNCDTGSGDPTGIGIVTYGNATLGIAPNPASDWARITVEGTGTITVYDLAGTRVMSMPVDTEAVINVSSWARGMYIVRYTSALGVTATGRLLH